ncbi:MAG: cytochrome c biogenesis heme-transporting ATPase CcmA [Gammaproteobacteria bacterium]
MGTPPHQTLTAETLELWRGDRCLFSDLNLSAAPGELLQVTGPNGSGKTSLLRVLTGLTQPESGRVLWGAATIGQARYDYQASMGYVAHREGLYDDLSLRQNLTWGCGLHQEVDTAEIDQMLAHTGLAAAADVPAYALSAGQKRRLSLARIALSGKALWILDEPLANLDVDARQWCDDLIARHVEQGGSVVATSHQPLCGDRVSRREVALTG